MITKTKTRREKYNKENHRQETHGLAIKVLRLQESLYQGRCCDQTKQDRCDAVVRLQENILLDHIDSLEDESQRNYSESEDLDDVDDLACVRQFLLQPQCPVNIHLGELFSGSIWAYNESQQTMKNIFLQVDLLTSSESQNLAFKHALQLSPGEAVNIQVHHKIKKMDSHILVCEVKYESFMEQRMTLRKFFKIQVLESLRPINDGAHFEHARGNSENLSTSVDCDDGAILESFKKLYLQISSLLCNMVSCFKVYHYQ